MTARLDIQQLRRLAKEQQAATVTEEANMILSRYGSGPLTCECCGFKGLQRAKIVDGRLLGPECSRAGHRFPCRREGA